MTRIIRIDVRVVRNNFTNGLIETTFTEDDLIYYPAAPRDANKTNSTNRPNDNMTKTNNAPLEFSLEDLPF